MNDVETVALVGGGHSWGKNHGACPKGAGMSPKEDSENPWPGLCGTGKGADTFTAGFEGSWTTKPTYWDSEYFQLLVKYKDHWKAYKGPGGKYQWRVNPDFGPTPLAPGAQGVSPLTNAEGKQEIAMLTSDIALMSDPENKYQDIGKRFAEDTPYFDKVFKHAWYKLTSRDMGPRTRCIQPKKTPFQVPPS